MGVILAVAGSAVGLGNFLKFPGQIATYGGAAFMIAYVVSFFLVGIPISLTEWTMGRHGGAHGFNSPAGVLGYFCKSKKLAYVGILGPVLTLLIYCYYIYIEAWCLGYAYNFLTQALNFSNLGEAGSFFQNFIGSAADGESLEISSDKVLIFLIIAFLLNFWMIYRGVSRGIELFCKYAMPTLVVLAIIIVARMMTLSDVSPDHPERTINQGLGFMWNPVKIVLEENRDGIWESKARLVGDFEILRAQKRIESLRASEPRERIVHISVFEQLANPSIWIAAAGQVFFSLTVGFGAIMTYASYLKRRDDIVLSSLTSCSANEFCEVCLGGMITVPAAVAFMGVAGTVSAGLTLFDLGFRVLPLFFASMPAGWFFGFLFFALLFLAAVTSSLSMLQPGMAFIEESMGLRRRFSTLLLGVITFFITGFVVYFSKDLKAMDTLDFWMGQVAIYVFATVQVVAFSWYFGVERGIRLTNEGSVIKLPRAYGIILKYVTPVVLIAVFVTWVAKDVFGILGDGRLSPHITDIVGGEGGEPNAVAWMSVMIIAAVYAFFAMILSVSKKYDSFGKDEK